MDQEQEAPMFDDIVKWFEGSVSAFRREIGLDSEEERELESPHVGVIGRLMEMELQDEDRAYRMSYLVGAKPNFVDVPEPRLLRFSLEEG